MQAVSDSSSHIFRSMSEPIRSNLSWSDRWERSDRGTITSWERGREKANEDAELAARASHGELVILPWKGGVEKALKSQFKYGALNYLAMWQGLRGDDLDIQLDAETPVTCKRTECTVVFTNDLSKIMIA